MVKAKAKALSLTTYRQKRDFSKTPEPSGDTRPPAGNAFVVQKHDARRLHFDFRLELDGVLKSWAVTRGPSLNPADKRLAVRTEDHPIEYGGFEGVIPKGEYGGGPVMLWDRGTWTPQSDPHEGLEKGLLKFTLAGERLKGGFALVRLRSDTTAKRENWLLVKERDEYATSEIDPVEAYTTSVDSDRDFTEILHGKATPRVAKVDPPRPKSPRKNTRTIGPFVEPQLATLVEKPPEGPNWVHEIKYDGYRIQAAKLNGAVQLYARSGLDWTGKLPHLAAAVAALPVRSARLDGEIVVLEERGRSSFSALQQALKHPGPDILYYVFDLLEWDGEDLRAKPLDDRKRQLARLLQAVPPPICFSAHIEGTGEKVLRAACSNGLEGIVSKRRDKGYVSGRGTTWTKSKCTGRDEFVIAGYRASRARGRQFASLILGEYDADQLHYRGRVGTGFDDSTIADLFARLKPLAQPDTPLVDAPKSLQRDTTWVAPRLVAEIAYTERTPDGVLRHPSFLGLREDKNARDVKMARPKRKLEKDSSEPVRATARKASAPADATVLGIKLTHPDKVLYPTQGITKLELARYMAVVAPFMLPYAAHHPLSFVRCPEGSGSKCFFQKHRTPGLPPAIESATIRESDGSKAEYLMITTEDGLVASTQVGAIEIHLWGAPAGDPEHPDRIVFDLDPDESVDFGTVRRAAVQVRDLLEAAGLKSFPLLTGGKGIHVVAPLAGTNDWPAVKEFSHGLAQSLAEAQPDQFTSVMSKACRKGRIFIDWLRNDRGATAISPFSARARPGATVAYPVTWRQLAGVESASTFTVRSVLAMPPRRDPWEGYFKLRQSLSAAAVEAMAKHLTGRKSRPRPKSKK